MIPLAGGKHGRDAGARTSELRRVQWSDPDREARVWRRTFERYVYPLPCPYANHRRHGWNDDLRLAVLIDTDNTAAKWADAIFEGIRALGDSPRNLLDLPRGRCPTSCPRGSRSNAQTLRAPGIGQTP